MWKSFGCSVAIIVAVAMADSAEAQGLSGSVTVNSGQKIGLIAYWNCDTHILLHFDVSTPMHGTATVEMMKGDYCGRSNEPAEVVFYQSNPGFKGKDAFAIYAGGAESYVELTVQ
jgi:hypothetical protein